MVLHRWDDPEFKDEGVKAGSSTEEKAAVGMKDKGEMVNSSNTTIKEKNEEVVIDIEMKELQPLKPKK